MAIYENVIVPGDEDPIIQQIKAEQKRKEIETFKSTLAQIEVSQLIK
jgi:hypothetical protein